MDPFVEKLFRYRQILRGDLPSPARRTVEWLLVTAIREHTGLNPYAAPWGEQPTPSLVTVANDALEQAVTLTEAQFGLLAIRSQVLCSGTDTLPADQQSCDGSEKVYGTPDTPNGQVPEPGTLALIGLAFFALVGLRRKRAA